MNTRNDLTPAELEGQLIDLQSQIAFQDDTIQSLNDALALQQQDILLLKQQLSQLMQDLKGMLNDKDGGPSMGSMFDERPPHY